MNKKEFENKCLDYIEGRLSEKESKAFSKFLEENKAAKKEFEQFQEIFALAKSVGEETHVLGAGFSVQVMDEIRKKGEVKMKKKGLLMPKSIDSSKAVIQL